MVQADFCKGVFSMAANRSPYKVHVNRCAWTDSCSNASSGDPRALKCVLLHCLSTSNSNKHPSPARPLH